MRNFKNISGRYIACVLLCIIFSNSFSQNIDSLNTAFKNAKADTTKLRLLYLLSNQCDEADILKYATPGVGLADAIMKTSKNLSTENKKDHP